MRWLRLSAAVGLVGVLTIGVAAAQANAAAPLNVNIEGWAENSLTLPSGDILVSNQSGNKIELIAASTGGISTFANVPSPGGLAVSGNTLYAAFGNTPLSLLTSGGGVVAINLSTGAQQTLISGLGEVNGLALLPSGDVAYDVTVGNGTGVHRINPTTKVGSVLSTSILTPNGLAVGPDGQIYVGSTATGTVSRVNPSTGATSLVAGISVLLDDFGFLPDGQIVGATTLGQIDLINPTTGSDTPIASGYYGSTSAKPGGRGIVITTIHGQVTAIPIPG